MHPHCAITDFECIVDLARKGETMNALRDKITSVLKPWDGCMHSDSSINIIAYIILQLPSGLRAEKPCDEFPDSCITCGHRIDGDCESGTITRDISVDEALEHLLMCVNIQTENIGDYKLPSGESVKTNEIHRPKIT